MELRIEARISTLLILGALTTSAQPFTYPVRHQHLHGGATGTLRIDTDSITYTEQSKNAKHSHKWAYGDIQQLSVSAEELRILTYDDQKWQLGRDRDYTFDRLPEGMVQQLYPLFSRKLDQRFVAELADPDVRPLWQTGAKLRHGLHGSEGALLIGRDRIVFQTGAGSDSRTWRFQDIDNIATAGQFDLSITTLERSGWQHAGPTEFRFQLKQPLTEDSYNELWRRIYRVRSEQSQPDHRESGQ